MNYQAADQTRVPGPALVDLPGCGQSGIHRDMYESPTQRQQPRLMTDEEAEATLPLAHAMGMAERRFLELDQDTLEKYKGRVIAFSPNGDILGDAEDYEGILRLVEESGEDLGLCPLWCVDDSCRM